MLEQEPAARAVGLRPRAAAAEHHESAHPRILPARGALGVRTRRSRRARRVRGRADPASRPGRAAARPRSRPWRPARRATAGARRAAGRGDRCPASTLATRRPIAATSSSSTPTPRAIAASAATSAWISPSRSVTALSWVGTDRASPTTASPAAAASSAARRAARHAADGAPMTAPITSPPGWRRADRAPCPRGSPSSRLSSPSGTSPCSTRTRRRYRSRAEAGASGGTRNAAGVSRRECARLARGPCR